MKKKCIFYGVGKYKTLSYTTQKSHLKVIAEGDFLEWVLIYGMEIQKYYPNH